MSDQNEQQDEDFGSDQFVQLREAYKQAKKELKDLRAFREEAEPRIRQAALRDAGFEPESPQAKALLRLHEGELSVEALKATAEEYGIIGVAVEDSAGAPALSDEQKQAIASAARGNQLAAVGAPSSPQSPHERYREAEAAGNFPEMLAAQEEITRLWKASQSA
jgi:hypothetical protein